MSDKTGSLISIFLALGANFLIAVAKFAAAFFTGSGAMLAEAVHSSADCGNQLLLLVGLSRSKKEANAEHPLGYGMSVYFWSFIVAIILFSLGGLFSLYEGIEKIKTPHSVEAPFIALGVLGISILLEGVSLSGCLKQINRIRGNRSLLRWFRESRQSELIVVFGEDTAALTGLICAAAAVILTIVTGNPVYDAAGTIVIGLVLILVALGVGYEVTNLLIGQSADAETVAGIKEHLASRKEIARVLHLITLQMGPSIMVSVKAEMSQKKDAAALIEDINRCEKSLKEKFPAIKWSFFEPDIK
ncbi:MAG: cation diffusion facilitator family transporter [Spirochaetota bacterium]